MTARWACFALWGPRARDILQPLTPDSLSRGLPVHDDARDHRRRRAGARAARDLRRRARLGALLPDRVRRGLWSALWEAGRAHGLVAGGYHAIDSLRLEKGYRVWGADITPDKTPVRGRPRLLREARQGRRSSAATRCARPAARPAPRGWSASSLDDPRSVALGNEPVRVGGEIVGRVTSGGYGYTVERSIAYAYVPAGSAEPGTAVEIDIFGTWVPGEVRAEPLYDPRGARARLSGYGQRRQPAPGLHGLTV